MTSSFSAVASVFYMTLILCICLLNPIAVSGFLSHPQSSSIIRPQPQQPCGKLPCKNKLSMLREDESIGKGEEAKDEKKNNHYYYPDSEFIENTTTSNGHLFQTIFTEVNRMRLEEANTRQFLKARPTKFSYDMCREWVMAHQEYYSDKNGVFWRHREDWEAWLLMGGIREKPVLVPSDPEAHYRRLGRWISWDHFLGHEGGMN